MNGRGSHHAMLCSPSGCHGRRQQRGRSGQMGAPAQRACCPDARGNAARSAMRLTDSNERRICSHTRGFPDMLERGSVHVPTPEWVGLSSAPLNNHLCLTGHHLVRRLHLTFARSVKPCEKRTNMATTGQQLQTRPPLYGLRGGGGGGGRRWRSSRSWPIVGLNAQLTWYRLHS